MVNLKIDLPDGFLDEEIRCGHKVSAKMKSVWAVQLDLFSELDRVCRKYDIKYFTNGGKTLGAVRHKGFIPWDDDMDFMLSRAEYNRLCEVASFEFRYPYFFQTDTTESESLQFFAKLINCETTAICQSDLMNKDYHQGIWIDIFPYDNIVDDAVLFERQRMLADKYKNRLYLFASIAYKRYAVSRIRTLAFLKRLICISLGWFFKLFVKYYYKRFIATISLYDSQKTESFSLLFWGFDNLHVRKVQDFKETEQIDFEFLKVPVPINYERVLTDVFGDWKVYIKGASLHGSVLFDTGYSYKNYLNKPRLSLS